MLCMWQHVAEHIDLETKPVVRKRLSEPVEYELFCGSAYSLPVQDKDTGEELICLLYGDRQGILAGICQPNEMQKLKIELEQMLCL